MARPRVVILGGGFGGLFTALELGGDGVDVTLVTDEDHFLFTPMLYEYLSGEVEAWHIAPKYSELLDDNVHVVQDEATAIDLDAQRVILTRNKDPLHYDALVLAVGGITNYVGVEGAEQHSFPFRKLRHADSLRRRMVTALDHIPPDLPPQDVRRDLTFAVVGAGASGCELSTKMADLLLDAVKRRALHGEPRVLVVEMGDKIVPGMGEPIREFVEEALRESHVEVHTRTRVVSVTGDSIEFEHEGNREQLKTACVVWTGGVKMRPLIEQLNVEKTSRGLLKVKQTLQLAQHDNVLALGDIASFPDAAPTLAGTAQLAFQQSALAARNVKELFKDHEPQMETKHFEELGEALSLGTERGAVLLAGGQAFGGALARQARFALYTSRLPTWHHRLKVGASWFFEGTTPRPLLLLILICVLVTGCIVKSEKPAETRAETRIEPHLIVPVEGVRPNQLVDTFDQARSEGRVHDAIDIPAPANTPVLAASEGKIVKLFQSDRGGTTIYQLSPDEKMIFYYAHLSRYADGLTEGKLVRQGDIIAYVGDTGNAGAGNYHLHFSIALVTDPKRYWEGTNINPYPLLHQ